MSCRQDTSPAADYERTKGVPQRNCEKDAPDQRIAAHRHQGDTGYEERYRRGDQRDDHE